MSWDLVFFYIIGAISVLSALGVVASPNPIHSGILLVVCFLNVAGIFVMLGAEFLAIVQVIVYTGGILVLLLFVLMLVDPEELPAFYLAKPLQRGVGVLLGLILLLEIGAAIVTQTQFGPNGQATPANIQAIGGNVQALGSVLQTNYLLAFEVVSLVLIVGIIGAIVLALPERLGERIGTLRSTISLGHPRGLDHPAALEAGPRNETPIATKDRKAPEPAAVRRLVMAKDPDDFTSV